MPRVCTICTHTERQAIDAAIVAGGSKSSIARKFNVGRDAVSRHVAHVARKIARSEAREARTLAGLVDLGHAKVREVLDRPNRGGKRDELVLKAVDRLARLAELEFGTKSKVEQTTRPAPPSSPEEERAELARLKADIEERELELAGKGSVQ